jgi:hypothetical protein
VFPWSHEPAVYDCLLNAFAIIPDIAKEQQNYYSTVWMQSNPKEIIEALNSFDQCFSGEFFAEFIVNRPSSWRSFLCLCDLFLGETRTLLVHNRILRKAMDGPHCELLKQEKANSVKLFKATSLLFAPTSRITCSSEEEESILSFFNLRTLDDCDVAMYRCWETFDFESQSFKYYIEFNPAVDALLEVSMMEFAQIIQSVSGLPCVHPDLWLFDPKYWGLIAEFLVFSVFRTPSWISDIMEVVSYNGKRTTCLVHMFVSFDECTGLRNAVTVCIKPVTRTFSPHMFAFVEHQ